MTRTRSGLVPALLGLAALAWSAPLSAQQLPPLTLGQRVRVTAPSADMRREVATVVAISLDTLRLQRHTANAPRLAVPLVELRNLAISRGTQRHTWTGVALGAVVGPYLGAVAGHSTRDDPCQGWFRICVSPTAAVEAVVGGAQGGLTSDAA